VTFKSAFVFLITTDGSRQAELHRLITSSLHGDQIAVFLLLQNGANLSPELQASLPTQTVLLHEAGRIPLSVARNRLLDQLELHENAMGIDGRAVVLLADDDCWYPEDFFTNFPNFEAVGVCRALDPETGKHFSTFNLENRSGSSRLSPWELMFYGVSISFLFRYEAIKGMRFKQNIGLGNKISQGEESLFVMRLLERQRGLKVESYPQIAVYHPWKFASSSNNHGSLGYFLGWSTARGFSFVFPFFLFLWAKYLIAIIVRPKKLYWNIFRSLNSSFFKGVFDTENIGAPNA
jgi:hypothetical protein